MDGVKRMAFSARGRAELMSLSAEMLSAISPSAPPSAMAGATCQLPSAAAFSSSAGRTDDCGSKETIRPLQPARRR